MALQAKTNSNFWSTLWKQASQSMMLEVKFAPIMGQAIRLAYTAQAAATQSQADKFEKLAIINFSMFGVAMVTAAITPDKTLPGEKTAEQDAAGTLDETNLDDKNMEMQQPKTTQNIDDDSDVEETADASGKVKAEEIEDNAAAKKVVANKTKKGFGKKAKGLPTYVGGKVKKGLTWGRDKLNQGLQASMGFAALSGGFTGLQEKRYDTKPAEQQGIEGQEQALNKESESYSGFYAKAFSRSNDLGQGCQQNIDYAMSILKSAVDAITQAIAAMFRA